MMPHILISIHPSAQSRDIYRLLTMHHIDTLLGMEDTAMREKDKNLFLNPET
jgi:hypothetical protein